VNCHDLNIYIANLLMTMIDHVTFLLTYKLP